jgi:hypothetical protein
MDKSKLKGILKGFDEAIDTIKTWHGSAHFNRTPEDLESQWSTYKIYSPEMRRIVSARDRLDNIVNPPQGEISKEQ